MTTDIVTYPEMNAKIVELLRWNKENPVVLYAATRIEELEAKTGRLLEQARRAEAKTREAVAGEAALLASMRIIVAMKWDTGDDGLALGGAIRICERCLVNPSRPAAALLERLAELEAQADLRGELAQLRRLKPNEPCSHPGCLHHLSHPCEGCGCIAGLYPNERLQIELDDCKRERGE